jgi:large-conductance mechanosensitive channel
MKKSEKKYIMAIIFPILFLLLTILTEKIEFPWEKYFGGTRPLSWGEIWNRMPAYVIAAVVFGIFVYIMLLQCEKHRKKQEEKYQKMREEEGK